MKFILKCFSVLFIFVVVSCRETKNEDNNKEAVHEYIEKEEPKVTSVSEEIEQSSQELEKEVKELEEAIKELN